MVDLVVGVDVGGTTTRCLVVTRTGSPAGTGIGSGGNLRSSSGVPVDGLGEALSAAIPHARADDVRAGVFGIAGSGAAGASAALASATQAWQQAGLAGTPRVVTDLEVAFAAGTSRPDGLLLVAGTGAAAAAVSGRRVVRRCDGYGWLLGDEGSAVWLGLRGVRAALDAYDGRGPATRLRDDIAAHLGVGPGADLAQEAIAALHARAPAYLGALAPLVTRAADDGDAVATALVDAGADRLVAAVRAVRPERSGPSELVLAGSLLLADGPVRRRVRGQLAADQPELRLRDAGPGAAGAAALALGDLAGGALDAALHEAVLRAAAPG